MGHVPLGLSGFNTPPIRRWPITSTHSIQYGTVSIETNRTITIIFSRVCCLEPHVSVLVSGG